MAAAADTTATRSLLSQMLREGDFLGRARVIGWSGVLLAFELVALVFLVLWTHNVFVPGPPTTTGFSSFYAAGMLANGPAPWLAYDAAAHHAAQQAATQPGVEHFVFYYPPIFLLLCAPLAHLPYLPAFLLFEAASLALYLPVGTRILALGGRAGWVPVLAFPAAVWTFGLGQNALLTAALLGGGMLLLERRRTVLAGIVLGLQCYKPHLGLLLPVALLAGREWRAAASAAVTVVLLAGLSLAVFGWPCWHAYLAAFAKSGSVYSSGQVSFAAFVTPFGAALLCGARPAVAEAVQALAAVLAAVAVGWAWRRPAPLPARAAVLYAATLLAVPLALFYDMMPVGLGIFWLARLGRRDGFLPWERLTLALLFLTPLAARYVALGLHVPLGLLAVIALLALGLAHVRRATAAATSR